MLFGIGGSDSAVAASVESHANLYAKLGKVHGGEEEDGEDDCYEDDADDDWLTHVRKPPSLAHQSRGGPFIELEAYATSDGAKYRDLDYGLGPTFWSPWRSIVRTASDEPQWVGNVNGRGVNLRPVTPKGWSVKKGSIVLPDGRTLPLPKTQAALPSNVVVARDETHALIVSVLDGCECFAGPGGGPRVDFRHVVSRLDVASGRVELLHEGEGVAVAVFGSDLDVYLQTGTMMQRFPAAGGPPETLPSGVLFATPRIAEWACCSY